MYIHGRKEALKTSKRQTSSVAIFAASSALTLWNVAPVMPTYVSTSNAANSLVMGSSRLSVPWMFWNVTALLATRYWIRRQRASKCQNVQMPRLAIAPYDAETSTKITTVTPMPQSLGTDLAPIAYAVVLAAA